MADQTFGARLKALREKEDLTQEQLAERAGMHKLGIAKLERGERQPTWATVQALAKALGVRCTAFEGTTEGGAPPGRGPGRPRKPVEEGGGAAPPRAPEGKPPRKRSKKSG